MFYKRLSYILILSMLLQTVSASAVGQRTGYEITWHDKYVEISGSGNEASEEVTIALYDENGDMLYADQQNTKEGNEFNFKVNVEENDIAKIVFGGDKRESSLMDFFKKNNEDVIYLSRNGNDDAYGTSSSPVNDFNYAVSLADNQVYCLGTADIGGVIDLQGKNIVITGDVLEFSSEVEFKGDVYFENIKLGGNLKMSSDRNITFGKGVEFLTEAEITAENVITESEIKGTVIAGNVIFQKGTSKANVTLNAECVVTSAKGGNAVIKDGFVYIEPSGGRAYSINGGEYKVNPQKLDCGVYDIVYDYDFNLHTLKIEENTDGYLLKISASAYNLNKSEDKTNPVICVAVFLDGRLSEVKSEKVGNKGNVYKEIQIGKQISNELDIKVYMVDSFERLRPLANVLLGDNSEDNLIYVSPNGKAEATGAFSDPMTLEKAVMKAKSTAGKNIIVLRGGEYRLRKTLDLSKASNVEILAFDNETPVITSAEKIDFSRFQKITDDVKGRILNADAREKVIVADVSDLSDMGEIYRYELQYGSPVGPVLSVDGEKLTLARYPNKENGKDTFLTIASGTTKPLNKGTKDENFSFFVNESEAKEHMASWVGNDELHMYGYMSQQWCDAVFKGSIEKYGNEYRFVSAYPWRYAGPVSGGRIFFANLLEEIDSPGEWYLDRESKKLYLYPTSGMNNNTELNFLVSKFAAFTIKNSANVKINGLKFADCGQNAVLIENSNNIEVSDCEFTNILSSPISISGTNCIAKDNYIHNVSGSGITIKGGNSEFLEAGGNVAENNLITNYAEDRKCYYPGISVSGVGNKISGNTIKNAPHMALGMSGQLNVIEYNHVTDVCLETGDSGALYAGGNFTSPGNKIRYNYFENVSNRIGVGYTNNCVYLDDMFSSAEVYGNVFYNCQRAALFGGGRENTFVNNTMINCDNSLTIDARGTWGGTWTTAVETRLNALETGAPYYRDELWKNTFPNLYKIKDDHPELPMYNTVKNNVLYNTPEFSVVEQAVQNGNIEKSLTVTSKSEFLDFENKIFLPVENGMIYKNLPGFVAAEFDKIGVVR